MRSTQIRSQPRAALALAACSLVSLSATRAYAETAPPWDAGGYLCQAAVLPDTIHTVPANFPAAIFWPEDMPITAGTVTMFGAPARLMAERRFSRNYWLAIPTVSSTVGAQTIVPSFNCPPGVYRDAGARGSDMPRTFTTSAAVPFPTSAGTLAFKDTPDQGNLPVRFAFGTEFAAFAPLAGADVTVGEQTFSIQYGSFSGAQHDLTVIKNEGCPSTATSTPISVSVHIAGMSPEQDPAVLTATLPLACAVVSNYPYRTYPSPSKDAGTGPLKDGAGPSDPVKDTGSSDPAKDSGSVPASQPTDNGGCSVSRSQQTPGGSMLLGLALCLVVSGLRRRTTGRSQFEAREPRPRP